MQLYKRTSESVNTRGQDHVASCLSQPHDWQLERRANCHLRAAADTRTLKFFNFDIVIFSIFREGVYYITFFLFTTVLSHLLSHIIRKSTKSS